MRNFRRNPKCFNRIFRLIQSDLDLSEKLGVTYVIQFENLNKKIEFFWKFMNTTKKGFQNNSDGISEKFFYQGRRLQSSMYFSYFQ